MWLVDGAWLLSTLHCNCDLLNISKAYNRLIGYFLVFDESISLNCIVPKVVCPQGEESFVIVLRCFLK